MCIELAERLRSIEFRYTRSAISIIAIHFEWMGEANQTEMGRLTELDAKLQIAQHITSPWSSQFGASIKAAAVHQLYIRRRRNAINSSRGSHSYWRVVKLLMKSRPAAAESH